MNKLTRKQKPKLEKNLFLNSYICKLLGKKNFDELRDILKDTEDGFDEEGRSYVFYVLQSQENIDNELKEKLGDYDRNIKKYVDHINKKRGRPIKLKYFQYLSVLFTEIYLDRYFNTPYSLLDELNDYLEEIGEEETDFALKDLTKLAFWMATGSGKTIIMHINYLQFIKYNRGPHRFNLDNILLITPNESLSKQHLEDMEGDNIPCQIFRNKKGGYFFPGKKRNQIKVIDIYKLTEEKKGEGVTVHIESFGPNNLIFVDEGHKGTGGKKWRGIRRKLSHEGFTFEYSATFGQAISTAKNKTEANKTLHEYAKAILFDYSYRFFYKDGYGKDYRILNLKKELYEESRNKLMLANLLSFYEQKLLFEGYGEEIAEFNIKKPLWIFVGSSVSKTQKSRRTDIYLIIQFLTKVLKDEKWTIENIEKILKGKSGLLDEKDNDLYSPEYPGKKLEYLRQRGTEPKEIYYDILRRVFYTEVPTTLHISDLKKVSGEIALKAGSSKYFGLINIGDDRKFLKLIKRKSPEIPIENDEHTNSLFNSIDDPNNINLLLGAKKFIEGWDSWRVSNMGLLNIGKKEGAQIIQLFGRGVRLKGKNLSLKRSNAVDPSNSPRYLHVLETLNVFGIQANYMDLFRKHLESEGISTETYVERKLPIEINEEYLRKDLMVPKVDSTRFKRENFFRLEADRDITPSIDFMPKVEIISSIDEGLKATTISQQKKIDQEILEMLDWDKIYFKILEYKQDKDWSNISITKEVLRDIMEKELYELYCDDEVIKPENFEDIYRLEDVVLSILKKYTLNFYNRNKNKWIRKNMEITKLKKEDRNLNFENYTLSIKENDQFVLSEIESLIESRLEDIRNEFTSNYINNVYFDRHIYQPLLAESGYIEISPPGLNEGERRFIEDLKNYFKSNPHLFKDREIFILRNLSRRGVGLGIEPSGTGFFYPDFIIWSKKNGSQHLIFADPHGLAKSAGLADEKINFQGKVRELGEQLASRTGKNITMDSFLISVTPHQNIRHMFKMSLNEFRQKNVLFQKNDSRYIERMLSVLFNS